jgi:hypothetical protein
MTTTQPRAARLEVRSIDSAMVPFFNVGTLYEGAAAETRIAEAEAAELERAAEQHRTP